MIIDPVAAAFLFIFGLLIGSFLNVVIYRVPNEMSIIRPGSRCSSCGHDLKWFDLIPVLSYVMQKGRCRYCGERFSPRYAYVELLTGMLTLLLYLKYGASFDFVFYISLVYILIPCFFIDLDHMIIPNGLVITAAVFFVLGVSYKLIISGGGIADHLYGGLAGGGILLLIYIIGYLVYRREALGFGDVKLFFVTGLFLGLKHTGMAFLFSVFTGAIAGIIILATTKKGGKSEMPFGPFIVSGSILSIFIGDIVYDWYMGFFI